MICARCKKEQGDSFYSNDKTCIVCRKVAAKGYREARREYWVEYDAKRYRNDPSRREGTELYSKTEAGKAVHRKAKDKWLSSNPVKRAAHTKLGNALRSGTIVKPLVCECCGGRPSRLNGHHDDYSKPLSVRWLCGVCHSAWHEKNGEGANGG